MILIKAKSRLGLKQAPMKYFPGDTDELNKGVEDGPDAILTEDFLKEINLDVNRAERLDFIFSDPDLVRNKDYYKTLSRELHTLRFLINQKRKREENCLLVGGDHSVSYASIASFLDTLNKSDRVGIIKFDSHGDIHTQKSSISKNFHGMWLRPFFDTFDYKQLDKVSRKVLGKDILFIGNHLLEKEESRVISRHKITILSADQINQSQIDSNKIIDMFCSRYDKIYLTFDMDVFSSKEVASVGNANPDGFSRTTAFNYLDRILQSNKVVCADVVEINPRKKGNKQGVVCAQEVVQRIVGSWM